MNRQEFLALLENISVWKEGDKRAPHKPVMLLYAISEFQKGRDILSYEEIDKPVSQILKSLMPNKKVINPHYPFWYLKNDGVWHIPNAGDIKFRKGKTEPLKSELKKFGTKAGFNSDVIELIKREPDILPEAIHLLLETHFPITIQQDVINMLNLEVEFVNVKKRKRDPAFREKIMNAYGYQCAICGYGIRLKDATVGLEAAHIKWHQAGGPDVESNGLSLCCIHHLLFDRGAYTIGRNMEVLVSENVTGESFDRVLFDFHGRKIKKPKSENYYPEEQYLYWHQKEVFIQPSYSS